jgi:hypothetical protein
MIKQLIQNWKTTSMGLTAILGSIIHLVFAVRAHTADENSWTIMVVAVIGGLGLIFAGDSNVSSTASTKNAAEIDRINALGSDPGAPALAPEVKPVPPAPSTLTAAESVTKLKP